MHYVLFAFQVQQRHFVQLDLQLNKYDLRLGLESYQSHLAHPKQF